MSAAWFFIVPRIEDRNCPQSLIRFRQSILLNSSESNLVEQIMKLTNFFLAELEREAAALAPCPANAYPKGATTGNRMRSRWRSAIWLRWWRPCRRGSY